jgi:hypothetical protein
VRGNFGTHWPIKALLLFFGPTFGWGFVPLVAAFFYWLVLVKEALICDPRVLELCSTASRDSVCADYQTPGSE